MASSKDFLEPFRAIAIQLQDLNKQAVQQYSPVVADIIHSRSRDVNYIEHTLDGLLDFCGYDPALQLYRRLCRHYYDINPYATAEYVNIYRKMWDEESLHENKKKKSKAMKKKIKSGSKSASLHK
jgi:hypothetical protein